MLNWGLINDGAAFQALVNTLLLFEHPANRVFGRAGQDGGIDARNESGELIWQCKFHNRPTLGKAVADAKKELVRIKKYRTAGHAHAPLWQNAKQWILVTNLKLNPADLQTWQTDVVPSFQADGLTAEIWGEEKLEELLTKYPSVRDAFFEGENRIFLSLNEAIVAHEREGPRASAMEAPILGRERVLTQLSTFLESDKKIICIHGFGGVGKSRLLLEFGDRIADESSYQVLWGNVETMARSGNWVAAVLPEKPTLLLLDEPNDPRLIQALVEQMRGSGRMSGWKVVLAMRSPKDPVLRAYHALPGSIRATALELDPITGDEARQLVMYLIESGPLAGQPVPAKENAATQIAQVAGGFPIWLTLAVRVLETSSSLAALPGSVPEIARNYMDEVIQHQSTRIASQQQIEKLIRWLALYRKVNVEELPLIEFLTREAGFTNDAELKVALHSLVNRKVVVSRGVNDRLHEIKPDVINEFILSDWLTVEDAGTIRPSAHADEVVSAVLNGAHGKSLPNPQEVVRTLAWVELREKWQNHPILLLDPLVRALLNGAEIGDLNSQAAIVGLLNFFSFARVADTVSIVQTIRTSPKPDVHVDRGLFQPKTLTHQDVVYSLAWPLFTAAQYAEGPDVEALLAEMIELFYANTRGSAGRHNDGMKPEDLIPRLASGGRNFMSSYRDAIFARASRLMDKFDEEGNAPDLDLKLAKVLLEPFLSLERSQTDFNQTSFNVRNWYVLPDSPEGRRRSELRDRLRVMTENPDARLADFAWRQLKESHSSANRARTGHADLFTADLEADLIWVREWIKRPGTTLAALQKARGLWHWHAQFEETPLLRQIADECEAIYTGNNDARDFGVFFDYSKYEEVEGRVVEFGSGLFNATADQLEDVLTRAEEFAKNFDHWGEFSKVGTFLARAWSTNPGIEEFVRRCMGHDTRRFEFALAIVEERLRILRREGDQANLAHELAEKFGWVRSDEGKEKFMLFLYGRPHPLRSGLLTTSDLSFFLEHVPFLETRERLAVIYRLLGGMFHAEWTRVQETAARLWTRTPDEEKVVCFFNFVDGIAFIRLFHQTDPMEFGEEHFGFLLALLLDLPDIDELQGRGEHELEQMRDRVGRRPIDWLVDSIRHRIGLFEPTGEMGENRRQGKILPPHVRLSKFVAPLSPSHADNPQVRQSLLDLLAFNSHRGIGYYLPEYIHDLDPAGQMVPRLIVDKIRESGISSVVVQSWSRYAAEYPLNSRPWEEIAAAAISAAGAMSPRDQGHIYFSLESQIRSSSYPSGQMDPQPKIEWEECMRLEAAETNPDLLPYRAWRTKLARAEYDTTVARYQEEQGE